MEIKEALKWAEANLNESKMGSPALDAEVLLSFVLKKDRAWLFAHDEQKISPARWKKFQKLIERRQHREPVAYLTGHKEFYGLDFLVNKNVLIPRPETELIIDYLKEKLLAAARPLIVDVGTGSGCLAITIAKLWPEVKLLAIDQSTAALRLAKTNARRHGIQKQIKFIKGNLLTGLNFDKTLELIILANLPYLSTARYRQAPPEVRRFEPKQALLAGPDDLKYYRELINQITRVPLALQGCPLLTALLEIDPTQTATLSRLIKSQLPRAAIEIKKDLAGLDRLLIIKS